MPENRAEDGAEEDEGDATRAAARRIHVTRGSASKEGGRARGADEDEPEQNGNREVESRSESREHAAGDPEGEAGDQHGHSPEPVHGAARGKRRQSPGSEDDRRPQPTRLPTPTTRTTVRVATAAESCSIAEFAANEAESRIVLRRDVRLRHRL